MIPIVVCGRTHVQIISHILKLMLADSFPLSYEYIYKKWGIHFSKKWSHIIMHTLMIFHALNHAGGKHIVFYFAWQNFILLLVSSQLHRLYRLASFRNWLSPIMSYNYSWRVPHSLFYHSDNDFHYSILFYFNFLYFKLYCDEHWTYKLHAADFRSALGHCSF